MLNLLIMRDNNKQMRSKKDKVLKLLNKKMTAHRSKKQKALKKRVGILSSRLKMKEYQSIKFVSLKCLNPSIKLLKELQSIQQRVAMTKQCLIEQVIFQLVSVESQMPKKMELFPSKKLYSKNLVLMGITITDIMMYRSKMKMELIFTIYKYTHRKAYVVVVTRLALCFEYKEHNYYNIFNNNDN